MFTFISPKDFVLDHTEPIGALQLYDPSLYGKVICLDPGHGGKDRCNIGYSGKYIEADGVLDIALRLEKSLNELGALVIMTRKDDQTLSLAERCKIAEDAKADIFVSIHSDAYMDQRVMGATAFYSLKPFHESRKLAQAVLDKYTMITGLTKRGPWFKWNAPKTDDFYGVLRGTSMPAIILECAFHTNPREEAKLLMPEFRTIAAQGIQMGIVHYFKNL